MLLLDLPSEIIISALELLDCLSLLNTRETCRALKQAIDQSTAFQYRIALRAAGLTDVPTKSPHWTTAQKLEAARRHELAWRTLDFSSWTTLPTPSGSLWELYGGVWAHDLTPTTFRFYQLPSVIRKIDAREWFIRVDFQARDFSFDPSLNLAVFLEEPLEFSTKEFRVHLLDLSSGQRHPLAKESVLLFPEGPTEDMTELVSYTIRICGDYVAVMRFHGLHALGRPDRFGELAIWRWQTGELYLHLSSAVIRSFTFLTETSIIVASLNTPSVRANADRARTCFIVYDLTAPQTHKLDSIDTSFQAALPLFDMPMSPRAFDIAIYSDPSPSGLGSFGPEVPFCSPAQDRILIVNLTTMVRQISSKTFTVTFKDLLESVAQCNSSPNRTFQSHEWTKGKFRVVPSRRWTAPWVCVVNGLRFIQPQVSVSEDGSMSIEVEDYCTVRARRSYLDVCHRSGRDTKDADSAVRLGASLILPDELTQLEGELELMISEDNIVALESRHNGRKMHIFTF